MVLICLVPSILLEFSGFSLFSRPLSPVSRPPSPVLLAGRIWGRFELHENVAHFSPKPLLAIRKPDPATRSFPCTSHPALYLSQISLVSFLLAYLTSLLPQAIGKFDYVFRYSTTNGQSWLYADQDGPIPAGAIPPKPGKLEVLSTGGTTPPAVPTGLIVTSTSPIGISLGWDLHPNTDGDLAGSEVYRDGILLATVLGTAETAYTDAAVTEGAAYSYYIRAFDNSLNFSGLSNTVNATAEPRIVTLNFTVTVPATTDATGPSVYIAGFLDRLIGWLPQWNPGGVALTRVDATHWTIMLTGYESVQIEYKYALGDWDHVEKDVSCGEIANRQLTLTYGTTGVMNVNDIVPNWRNVAPCGN